jgi:hypothetical protein
MEIFVKTTDVGSVISNAVNFTIETSNQYTFYIQD